MSQHQNGGAVESGRTLLGHPRGLVILFFTEMWERFSFYGMRGLLILYLTQHFLFSDERSTLLYGAYTALVYVMTIVGGTLADNYLGARKAVSFGAILLVLGHFGMAFEGNGSRQIMSWNGSEYQLSLDGRGGDANQILIAPTGVSMITFNAGATEMLIADPGAVGLPAAIPVSDYTLRIETETVYLNILYLSLALIIAGVGFLKANISTMVGALYGFGDGRRDSGFTIFYMGINLGAFLSSILCGYLGIVHGWKYGFGLAGFGMLLGLAVFLRYQAWLEGSGEPPDQSRLKRKIVAGIDVEMLCYLAGLGIVVISVLLVMNAHVVSEAAVGMLGLVLLLGMVVYALLACQGAEKGRMLAAIYFIVAQIPFWALFEQAGSSLNLFTDRLVDREMFGINVPAPVFQALNAIYIVVFAPIMAWMWIALARKGRNPSTAVKFALGVFMAGLGFLVLVLGIKFTDQRGLTPMYYIFLIYWIHTIGELMISPVGLSAVTKLAPVRAVGMTMGAWFLYSGLSTYMAGVIAAATSAETIGGQLADAVAARATYAEVYSEVGLIAMAITIPMLLLAPVVTRMTQGAD